MDYTTRTILIMICTIVIVGSIILTIHYTTKNDVENYSTLNPYTDFGTMCEKYTNGIYETIPTDYQNIKMLSKGGIERDVYLKDARKKEKVTDKDGNVIKQVERAGVV